MKTCFSEENKTIWKPPISKRAPLSTNSSISEQFFYDPPLCLSFKNKTPPPDFRGEETMLNVLTMKILTKKNNNFLLQVM